jgi:DNA-binding transcriptional ArsR family regulator
MSDTILLPHDHGQAIAKGSIPEDERFTDAADIFKILGDEKRLKIFWILCHYEECVVNISALMGMTSPAVSHHLRQLKACGLITGTRRGKEVYYAASDDPRAAMLLQVTERILFK